MPIIGHQGLPHHVSGHHQVLEDFQRDAHDLPVTKVQRICGVGRTTGRKQN